MKIVVKEIMTIESMKEIMNILISYIKGMIVEAKVKLQNNKMLNCYEIWTY